MRRARNPRVSLSPRQHAPTTLAERGVALPITLIALVVLTALSTVFATLARTEPSIASNHLRSARARAMAESGLERALWALTHATRPGALPASGTPPNVVVVTTPSPPYDGGTLLAVGAEGGFRLTVSGTDANVRTVRSVGWSPATPDSRLASQSEVIATVARVPNLPFEAACTLCVGSSLALTGATTIDARGSETTDCGAKVAVAADGDLTADPSVRLTGSGAPADDGTGNVEERDWRRAQQAPRLRAADLDTLKALATTSGTYVRPASDAAIDLVDARDGVVFIDTPAGTHALTDTNRARIRLGPGFSVRRPFRGWIVVNGDISLEGLFGDVDGIVYAANSIAVSSHAAGRVRGMLIAAQALGAASLTLDDLEVRFDCGAARGAGVLPSGWFVRPGGYCDQAGGC